MVLEQVSRATPRRRTLTAIATFVCVGAMVAVAPEGPPVLVTLAVVVAAAASALSSPDARAAVANFVVAAGVFGTIAILIANDGVPTGAGRVALLALAGMVAAALVASVAFAVIVVLRDRATEFERHLLVEAAALAFVCVLTVAVSLLVVSIVADTPDPNPVVYVVSCVVTFALAYHSTRRRAS